MTVCSRVISVSVPAMCSNMADDTPYYLSQAQKFHHAANKILSLSFSLDESVKQEVDQLLDELNSLDYSKELTEREESERLLCQGIRFVQHNNEAMLTKFCHLIVNIMNKQQINPGQECLTSLLEYLIGALRRSQSWCFPEVLMALGAVLYESNTKIEEYWDCLVGPDGMLIKLASSDTLEVKKATMTCLENFTMRCPGEPYIGQLYIETCYHTFLETLHTPPYKDKDELSYCRMLISALKGLQNLISHSRKVHYSSLGELLTVLKVLMFCGIPGHLLQVPRSFQQTASIPSDDLSPKQVEQKEGSSAQFEKNNSSKKKQRHSNFTEERNWKVSSQKQKLGDVSTNSNLEDKSVDRLSSIWTPTSEFISNNTEFISEMTEKLAPAASSWAKMSSSESEYSDTENGQMAKLRIFQTKVRSYIQALILTIVKNTERRVMFGYLPSFLTDSSGDTKGMRPNTLLTSILKDPSPKIRAGMLVALTAMLDGSKQYLALADDSEKHHAAFIPFSSTLASMIKEIHRCLLLSLMAENSPLTLTQLIKCLSTVTSNVPYNKLRPGLLTKIVKHLRLFLSHRDSNVRVACLTTLGSIVSAQPPLSEVTQILMEKSSGNIEQFNLQLSFQDSDVSKMQQTTGKEQASEQDDKIDMQQTFGAMIRSSGKIEEDYWLVQLCKDNIFPMLGNNFTDNGSMNIPLPVRLESLQVLAALAKGYFFTVRSNLNQMADLVHACISDPEPSVRLHGARLFEQIAQAMLQELTNRDAAPNPAYPSDYFPISVEETVTIWLHLLDGPLPFALEDATHPVLRATGCACLSNIGSRAFEHLPTEHHNICINLLLCLSADSDNNVKAEAIRALGVYVLFPCLREDICFLADAANAIITSMDDSNLGVRIKACWALGNISDAFVLNRVEGSGLFVEELSDVLLHKLCCVAITGAQDNDKVKSNGVRAIGNLLRFMSSKTVVKGNFSKIIEQAVQALIKNISSGSDMKVRWNACYAIGNMFRNEAIPFEKAEWLDSIFSTLLTVIKECKNFKVRINAALALMVPMTRSIYGTPNKFAQMWNDVADGLDTSLQAADFTEYNYRDNLLHQLCCLLCHLASLLELNDLTALHEVLKSRKDALKVFLHKFVERINPEKDSMLLSANSCIKNLEQSDEEHHECISLLRDLFQISD